MTTNIHSFLPEDPSCSADLPAGDLSLLECCVDSLPSALQAQKGGAQRLELCANLVIGGTTPSLTLFQQIRERITLPVHILIRPRFGDFLYQEYELEEMCAAIDAFRTAGADGIVIGCLSPDGSLDLSAMKQLISHAADMKLTLHRAFDMCADPLRTLEDAISLGIHTILTSGCQPSALAGSAMLSRLARQAGNRIHIMAGAGIDAEAVEELLHTTPIRHFHMSGKRRKESRMVYRNPQISMGLPGISEYEQMETDAECIARVCCLLKEFHPMY